VDAAASLANRVNVEAYNLAARIQIGKHTSGFPICFSIAEIG